MYELLIRGPAQRDLERLDPPIRRRVASRLDWFVEHFDEIQPEPLSGQFAGQYKIRVGNYRVLYEFDRAERTLTVLKIRHRREIYD